MEACLAEYKNLNKFEARAFLRKPAKFGDAAQMARERASFSAKLRILILLEKLPDAETHVAVDGLEEKLAKSRASAGMTGKGFIEQVKTFGCLSSSVKGALLCKACPQLNLDVDTLKQINEASPHTVSDLFTFVFAVSDGLPFPGFLSELSVLERSLKKRAKDLDRPDEEFLQFWQGFMEGDTQYMIDWGKVGCFRLLQKEDTLFVSHLGRSMAPWPDGLAWPTSTPFLENFSDLRGCIMIASKPNLCKHWWGKQAGPNAELVQNTQNKLFLETAQHMRTQVAREKAPAFGFLLRRRYYFDRALERRHDLEQEGQASGAATDFGRQASPHLGRLLRTQPL